MKLIVRREEIEGAIKKKIDRANSSIDFEVKDWPKGETYSDIKARWEWLLAHLPPGEEVELDWEEVQQYFG